MSTVLFVGDSITVGLVGVAQGKTNGASFRGPAGAALGWRAVGPFKDPTGLLHGGVGGATTYTFENGSAQFVTNKTEPAGEEANTWVFKYDPEVIHLMLGVNDIFSFTEPVKDLYDRLMGLAGKAVVQQRRNKRRGYVLLSTICESMFPLQVVRAKLLNDLIVKTNETGKDYTIRGIDSAGAFNVAIGGHEPFHAMAISKYTVDGTHPNQAGYDLIASSLVKGAGGARPESGTSKNGRSQVVAAGGLLLGGWALGKAFRWW